MRQFIDDPRLARLIARIPVLEKARSAIPVGGGLTNMNYRIDTDSNIYMMRVSDTRPSLLTIDRENEMINTSRAHEAGVGAAVIDSLPEENVLVISWINAETLHSSDFRSRPELLRRIANSLRLLHSGPLFEGRFHFPSVRRNYLKTVSENGYFIPTDYLRTEPLITALENIIASDPEDLVPCNNDLLAENFMDDGQKIWIIDYEYSGQNEASFEIGNFVSESFLSDEQIVILCDAYWQQHIPQKIARAMAWSIIARFGWVMWASIQEVVSCIDFDFRSWGMRKWDSVMTELNSTRYQSILEILKK
jgi:thiamine kinase-like enzyme